MTSLTDTNEDQCTEHGQCYGTEDTSKCAQCTSTALRILHAELHIAITGLRRHRTLSIFTTTGTKKRTEATKHVGCAAITGRRNGCCLLIRIDAHLDSSSWKSNLVDTHTHRHRHRHRRKQSKVVRPQLRQITGITWWGRFLKCFDSFVCAFLLLSFLVSGSTRHFSLALALRCTSRCACAVLLSVGAEKSRRTDSPKAPKGRGNRHS